LIDKPDQLEADLTKDAERVWEYKPLVHKISRFLSDFTTIPIPELNQEGYRVLADLAYKIDWLKDNPQISNLVKRTVEGQMKNYVARMSKVVSIPAFNELFYRSGDSEGFNKKNEKDSGETTEDRILFKEKVLKAESYVDMLSSELKPREVTALCMNIIADEPLTTRELAEMFGCSPMSIHRDIQRIKGRINADQNI
jgi:DNA-binding Lrp family transcriptional regulator